MSHAQESQEYIQTKVNFILESLVTAMLLERPEAPAAFMIKWLSDHQKSTTTNNDSNVQQNQELEQLNAELRKLQGEVRELEAKAGNATAAGEDAANEEEDEEEEEDDGADDVEDMAPPPGYQSRGPRASVSAEAYGAWNKKEEFVPPVHQKTDEQTKRIEAVLEKSFLFAALDKKELGVVILAMVEKDIEPGTRIINQDDDGDVLFVVESGTLDCYKKFEKGGEEKMVKTVSEGDAFGELALLYNCPRAASVQSRDKCILWQLDRQTFNHIVKDAAAKKRDKYDVFLKNVPLLEGMETYERNQIADALKTESYKAGSVIMQQGDAGEKFYIVEDGQCIAQKTFVEGAAAQEVMQYKEGDYFGELALLRNEPRAASVLAKTDCSVLYVDRRTFKKMLGPLEEILKRNSDRYATSSPT